jgi:hypothetical protein
MKLGFYSLSIIGLILTLESASYAGGYTAPAPREVPVPVPVPTPPARLRWDGTCGCYYPASLSTQSQQDESESCMLVRNRLLEFVQQSTGCLLERETYGEAGYGIVACSFANSTHVQNVAVTRSAVQRSSSPQAMKGQVLDFLRNNFCANAPQSAPPSLTPGPSPDITRAL